MSDKIIMTDELNHYDFAGSLNYFIQYIQQIHKDMICQGYNDITFNIKDLYFYTQGHRIESECEYETRISLELYRNKQKSDEDKLNRDIRFRQYQALVKEFGSNCEMNNVE